MRAFGPILVVVFMAAVATGSAQQPNTPAATMTWNGQGGPAYPVVDVPLPWGTTATLAVSGLPYAPFALATAAALAPAGRPVLGNELLDLDLATLQILADPAQLPAFNVGASGTWQMSGVIPILPAGIRIPYQAAVYDPAAPALVRLTAATQIITSVGVTVTGLTLFDDGFQLVDLASHGLSLDFFGATYSTLFVNSNGFISFGTGSTDFTPSSAEFQSQMPRIALQWCDLAPNAGGTVTVTIDPSSFAPSVHVEFLDVPDYGGGGFNHRFAYTHFTGPVGDFAITHAASNVGAVFPQLVGITPGLGVAGVAVDFTSIQDGGGLLLPPAQATFESFGTVGQGNYSGPTNPFDLIGRVLWFVAQQGGAGGYFML